MSNTNETPQGAALAPAHGSAAGCEPDWPIICGKLARQCEFALGNLKPDGWTGTLMDFETGKTWHWKDEMADVMELIPGLKVDRELMHVDRRKREAFAKKRGKKSPNDRELTDATVRKL